MATLAEVPLALAELHWSIPLGRRARLTVDMATPKDTGVDPLFPAAPTRVLADLLIGAGFEVESTDVHRHVLRVTGRRVPSLPDTVGPDMRVLVCGLNPSEYAADRGVGYARPGNRFWPAAVGAGLVSRPHDPLHALRINGVGMTDLVKRATTRSSALRGDEYRQGAGRVERLVRWLQPSVVCFVGLEGWRAAVERTAVAGPQPRGFGGRPAYVMPSTSGINAHCSLDELAAHLRSAAALAN